jgi:REP element-mobilizing transposase RayT
MRRARITYKGAYHHAMNRGHEGKCIFSKDREKEFFLKLLVETSKILKVRILAFCLMDNHYHLVLENSSARRSDFFKQLNGQYRG